VSTANEFFFGGVLYLSLTSLIAAAFVLSIRATRRQRASEELKLAANASELPAVEALNQ